MYVFQCYSRIEDSSDPTELEPTFLIRSFILVAQMVKNPPAMQKTQVQSLGHEDTWEKGMAVPSSILTWEPLVQRNLVGYSPWGRKESDTTE